MQPTLHLKGVAQQSLWICETTLSILKYLDRNTAVAIKVATYASKYGSYTQCVPELQVRSYCNYSYMCKSCLRILTNAHAQKTTL